MVYNVTVVLDRNVDGTIRRLRDASYRFEVCIELEGVTMMAIKGFRLPPSGVKIIPPSASSAKGMYQIVEMDPEFEIRMKKLLMDDISRSVVTGDEQYRN